MRGRCRYVRRRLSLRPLRRKAGYQLDRLQGSSDQDLRGGQAEPDHGCPDHRGGNAGWGDDGTGSQPSRRAWLLPETHLVRAGYVDAALLVASQVGQTIDLLGPVSLDHGWRAQSEGKGAARSLITAVEVDKERCSVLKNNSPHWKSPTCF